MIDADYTDDIVFLANTSVQYEPLRCSLEQTAEGISVYLMANKIEFMRFKRRSAINT